MLMSEGVELTEQNNKTFQIGRTIVTVKAKSETPWKKKHDEKGQEVDIKFKGEELQRMEELLRGTKSMANKMKQDQEPRMRRRQEEDLAEMEERVHPSEGGRQRKDVLEIDGVRYIILKELDGDEKEFQEDH